MVPEHDEGHATHTTEGTKMRSDRIEGGSAEPPEDVTPTSDAGKIRSDGLPPGAPVPADVDDTDEATKMESDGLDDSAVESHSTSTEADKIDSDRLR